MSLDRSELFKRYEKLVLHDANEANTRLKVIDEIIFDLLGWSRDDVTVEERISQDGKTTYADYIIKTGMSAFVVEAKKVGAAFSEIPAVRRTRLRGKLMTGATGDAIKQARDYAYYQGIGFAIATNGGQWIIFPAQRTDLVPQEQSSAVIFPSLRSVLLDDASDFEDLLSRENVINGSLENEFLGRVKDQLQSRRINDFYDTHFSKKRRNQIYPFIEHAIVTAFTEDVIKNDPELLKKCYVNSPDRRRFDNKIRMYVRKTRVPTAKVTSRPLRGKKVVPSKIH